MSASYVFVVLPKVSDVGLVVPAVSILCHVGQCRASMSAYQPVGFGLCAFSSAIMSACCLARLSASIA